MPAAAMAAPINGAMIGTRAYPQSDLPLPAMGNKKCAMHGSLISFHFVASMIYSSAFSFAKVISALLRLGRCPCSSVIRLSIPGTVSPEIVEIPLI